MIDKAPCGLWGGRVQIFLYVQVLLISPQMWVSRDSDGEMLDSLAERPGGALWPGAMWHLEAPTLPCPWWYPTSGCGRLACPSGFG